MKNKKMFSIKLISLLLMICSLLSAFTIRVNADEQEQTENVGWLHISVDVDTNRPDDFRDYNFYVNVVNKDTGEWNLADIYYDNNYKTRITLPYGNYYIAEAGVKKDYLGTFALTTGQEFSLNEESHAVELQLGFDTYHIVESEVEEPVDEIIEEPVTDNTEIQEPIKEPVDDTIPDIEQDQIQENEEENSPLENILISILKFLIIIIIVGIIVYIYNKHRNN